jgi:phospholipid/cholesterol/gamma-HCH transport system ATP-binding protein
MSATETQENSPRFEQPAIKVRGLRTQFGVQVIHDGLDLTVRRGEVIGVVGGSGTGKSVLMRTIIGLQKPAGGEVELLGEPITAGGGEPATRRLRGRFGMMFQDGALFSSQTVAQNIQAPMRERGGIPDDLMVELARLKIQMVGLPPEAGAKYPSELSGVCVSAPAWRGPWRSTPRWSFWTSRRRGLIRLARRRSTI